MSLPEIARALAIGAHAGQTDQQGRDYYDHHIAPIALALRPFGPDFETAGLLHDIIEDTPVGLTRLNDLSFSGRVLSAIVSVTRRPDEEYADLIGRACLNPVGRVVKLADNTLNLLNGPSLALTQPEKAARMREERYLPARRRLLAVCRLTEDEVEAITETLRPFAGPGSEAVL